MKKTPWFAQDLEDDEAAKHLHGVINTLENDQSSRTHDLIKLMSIYHNRDLTHMSPFAASLLRSMPMAIHNVSKSIIDTLVAKFVSNETKATFDVDDGDWAASMKAESLDKFCFGEAYRLKAYPLYETAMRDCAIMGDGWVKFYAREGKVFAERVFPVEMRLDPAQCVSGPPRDLYQIRYIDRSQAMAYYNEHAEAIEELPTVQPPYPYPGVTTDIVRLVEAWHLPDYDTGEGGKYMFTCNDICLACKPYDRKTFPFVRFSWTQDLMGGYSVGLLEELIPMQSEYNKLKKRHLQGLHIHGLPRVYQAAGSQLDPEELTNSPVQIWRYTGSKPEVDQSRCVAPELVAEMQQIIANMWQTAGVSPLQAGTDVPSRFDSRPGLREYAAMADEKHAMPSKSWERGILDGATNIIAVARQIVSERGEYKAMGAGRDFVRTIDFKDCDLDDDCYRLKLQSTNLLPTTPAGKRMAVQDLAGAGAFQDNPKMLWQLLTGAPDIDAVIGNETAGQKLVQRQVYEMTVNRKYFPPDKYQDVSYALHFASNAIQRMLTQTKGSMDGDVAEVYNLLDQYCVDCDTILQSQAAAQMAAQGALNGPGGAGAAGNSAAGGPSGVGPAAEPVGI